MSLFPDIAKEKAQTSGRLDRVGMENIELPVQWQQSRLAARIDAFVSLDARETKGIHMSRLFLIVHKQLTNIDIFDVASIQAVLGEFLSSHAGLSERAEIIIRSELPLERKALKSDHRGWRFYPFHLHYVRGTEPLCQLQLEITYSSTCPCSAALARQLIQQKFADDFGQRQSLSPTEVREWLSQETSILATPHGQRSLARIELDLATSKIDPVIYIDAIENALGTPVQTAVKREDEQEFARLNGANLMFAEDAARRMHRALSAFPELVDYRVKAHHFESLHADDAVAYSSKKGG